jgi:2-methylcitrate dehydratase PrpD
VEAVTSALARYIAQSREQDLPGTVRREVVRAFVNFVGCAVGGSAHPACDAACAALGDVAGPPQATVLGRGGRMDILNATLLNALAASAYAFDDTHLKSVGHPTAPAAAALLALAERRPVGGREFVHALALAIEVQCRLGNALAVPPARTHVGFYMTGLTGAAGVAAGAAKLLGLDEQRTLCAIGIGAAQAGGFRATHASMCSPFVPAHAGRDGLMAALLAAKGFTARSDTLEARNGFADVFGTPANLDAITDRLGERFECLAVAAKPYPAGVVIHPAIEACLVLATRYRIEPDCVERIALRVHPLALTLTGNAEPRDAYAAQVSVQHWAAAAIVRRRATLDEADDACVRDPMIVAMRRRVHAEADDSLGADEAVAEIALRDGATHCERVAPCLGSERRPMSDAEIERKFMDQAVPVLCGPAASELATACWNVHALPDVSRIIPDLRGSTTNATKEDATP